MKSTGNTGKLFVTLPNGVEWDMTVHPAGSTKVLSNTLLKKSMTLQVGTYDLEINHIWIKGVLIEKGSNTRLKAGALNITTSDAWTLYDETKKTVLINSLAAETRGLPVGKYILSIMQQDMNIEIKDGETNNGGNMEAEAVNPSVYEKWVISPLSDSNRAPVKNLSGKLYLGFAGDTIYNSSTYQYENWKMKIARNGYPDILLSADDLKKAIAYPLSPGVYQLKLNNVPIENVPIVGGKETKIKTGRLKITSKNIHSTGVVSWRIFKYGSNWNSGNDMYINTSRPVTITLPVGTYGIKIWGNYPVHQIKIKDKEDITLEVELGVCTITSYKHWKILDTDESITQAYAEGGGGSTQPNFQIVTLPVGTYRLVAYQSGVLVFTGGIFFQLTPSQDIHL